MISNNNIEIHEDERIDVFHKVAPSVVFIDTFKEVTLTDESSSQQQQNTKQQKRKWDSSKWKNPQQSKDNMKRLQMQWKKNQNRLKKSLETATIAKGSGTGFVWDKEGHIITNNHVVEGAKYVEVSLLTKKDVNDENGKLYPTSLLGREVGIEEYHWRVVKAKVIGTDPGSDIAVIQIDAPQFDIHPVMRGDEHQVMVGAACLAIGNPYGLDHTLSSGIVSAKGRVSHTSTGMPLTNLIQT